MLDIPVIFFRPLNVIVNSMCKQFFRRLPKERNTADEELVKTATERPPDKKIIKLALGA